ncbi:hypothetical protein Sjap_007711 [Stephania japonica]|uniref:Uncharacterized protein n=1 Tax=Stephania japonica TaxID=461633 RepID=A0AAP0JQH1_9MAGN
MVDTTHELYVALGDLSLIHVSGANHQRRCHRVPKTGHPYPKSNSATGNCLPDDRTRPGLSWPSKILVSIIPGL